VKIDAQILEKFGSWQEAARDCEGVEDCTSVNLATANKAGRVANRMVLLKSYDEHGFVFYTNYESKKGRDLAENPHASLCFYWAEMGRQIRIEGVVSRVSEAESDEYFASRQLKSRIGAWASRQSQPLASKASLLLEIAKLSGKASNRPSFWGGYRVSPDYIEFWENGAFRIHNRQVFEAIDGAWVERLLYP